MPKIWISTDEWYPWYDHSEATEVENGYLEQPIEVDESTLARLDQLASYIHEYQTTLAGLYDAND